MELDYIQEVDVEKFNPYHDQRGRFTTAGNARSFTIRTRGGAYQQGMVNRAIQREKDNNLNADFTSRVNGRGYKMPKLDNAKAEADREKALKALDDYVEPKTRRHKNFNYKLYDKQMKIYLDETDSEVWRKRAEKRNLNALTTFTSAVTKEQRLKNAAEARNARLKEDAHHRAAMKGTEKYKAWSNYELYLSNKYKTNRLGPGNEYLSKMTKEEKKKLDDLYDAIVTQDKSGRWRVAKSEGEYIDEIEKFNPYHDSRGRFTTAGNAASFTIRTRGGAYQRNLTNRAIEREKERTKEATNNLSKPTGNMELDRKKEWENAECAVRIGSPSPFNKNQTDISVVDFSGTGAKEDYNTVKGDARNYGEKVYLLTYDQYNNAVAKLDDANAFANYDSKQVANFKNNIEKDNVRVLDKKYLQEQKNAFDKNHIYDIPKGGNLPSNLGNIKIVSGDTFSNKAALKAAGFKWNSKKRVWEKPEDVVKSNVEYIDEPTSFDILKSDDDKHLVFGWASIVQTADGETVEDIQKDIIDPEDLETAAYDYVLNFRDTGEEHLAGYRKKGKLVESCVFTEEKQRAMGLAPGTLPVGWWIGFHIDDGNAWKRIKDGTYKMFSIEGKAERVPVEKKAPTGCGVIVLNDDGEILIGNRAKENVIGGPGGHIEEGETPEEAAIRETFEEFGIVCRDLQPLGVLDGGEKHGGSAVFLCEDYSGRIKTNSKEMTEPRWLSIEELEDKELFPPFAQSLELLSEGNVEKFNPYHDARGRFAPSNGATSFTYKPGASKAHDKAIEREKEAASDNKSLKLTKENEAYLRDYTAGKYRNACAISQEIVETGGCKKYIKSLDNDLHDDGKKALSTDIEQTKQLMAAIDNQPVRNDLLVRVEAGHADLKPGETITWGIRSTSRDANFGDKVRDQKDEGSESKAYFDGQYIGMTEYRVVGPKKALDIDMYSDFDQLESLVCGKFRVKSVDTEKYASPKAPKTLGERLKDEPELNERFTPFTSKKGREMIKDNKTGKIHEKNVLDKVLRGDDTFGYADSFVSSTPPPSFKPKTIVELEQIL